MPDQPHTTEQSPAAPAAPTRRLDAPGMACLDLTPLINATMRELEPGEILQVLTDDPAARHGVPAWCRLTSNRLVSVNQVDQPTTDHTLFSIAKKYATTKENQP